MRQSNRIWPSGSWTSFHGPCNLEDLVFKLGHSHFLNTFHSSFSCKSWHKYLNSDLTDHAQRSTFAPHESTVKCSFFFFLLLLVHLNNWECPRASVYIVKKKMTLHGYTRFHTINTSGMFARIIKKGIVKKKVVLLPCLP